MIIYFGMTCEANSSFIAVIVYFEARCLFVKSTTMFKLPAQCSVKNASFEYFHFYILKCILICFVSQTSHHILFQHTFFSLGFSQTPLLVNYVPQLRRAVKVLGEKGASNILSPISISLVLN